MPDVVESVDSLNDIDPIRNRVLVIFHGRTGVFILLDVRAITRHYCQAGPIREYIKHILTFKHYEPFQKKTGY